MAVHDAVPSALGKAGNDTVVCQRERQRAVPLSLSRTQKARGKPVALIRPQERASLGPGKHGRVLVERSAPPQAWPHTAQHAGVAFTTAAAHARTLECAV